MSLCWSSLSVAHCCFYSRYKIHSRAHKCYRMLRGVCFMAFWYLHNSAKVVVFM